MNLNMNYDYGVGGLMLLALAIHWTLIVVIHICFATRVHWDARRLSYRGRLFFTSPGVWALATLLGGVFVATAYWLMHHSRLNPLVIPLADAPSDELA